MNTNVLGHFSGKGLFFINFTRGNTYEHSITEHILTWGFLLKSSVNDYVIKSSSLLSEISSIRKINCNFKNSGEGK